MLKNKSKESLFSMALLVVGFVWGFGFIVVQWGYEVGYSPILINAVRFTVAAIFAAIFFRKSIASLTWKDVKFGLAPALVLAAGFYFQNAGQCHTTPGNASLITGAYIVLVPFAEAIFSKRKLKLKSILVALITFVGLAFLSLPTFSFTKINIGDIMVFAAAIFFALQFVFLDKSLKKVDAHKMTFLQLAIMAIVFDIMLFTVDLDAIKKVNFANSWYLIIYLGFFSSFFAYVVQTNAQKFVKPVKVSIFMSTEALFGAVFSIILGYDAITTYFVIGGIIALTGVVLANIFESKGETKNEEKIKATEEVEIIKKEKADVIECK